MFAAGVVEEVHAALTKRLRALPADHRLREIAELPPEAANEAMIVRTRRYAAYQRKWMRRIPGLASVAADRPAGRDRR